MKTVMQLMGLEGKVSRKRGLFGVEIEVEGDNLPHPQKYWACEHDGSLRGNSMEYVMDTPRSLKGVYTALRSLQYQFKLSGGNIRDSNRCGVHVHVNVQSLTAKQLFTFITTYLVLEDLLVDWCGESRVGNLFCLRTKDADYFYTLVRAALERRHLGILRSDEIRYCSINLAALGKYGSVEFRSMRTPTDLNVVYDWVKMLDKVYNNSLTKFADPRTVIEAFSMSTAEEFVQEIMGEMAPNLLASGNLEPIVKAGVRRAQEVAYAHDWGNDLNTNWRRNRFNMEDF